MGRIPNNETRTTFDFAEKAYNAIDAAQRAVKEIVEASRVRFVELDFDKEFSYIRVCIKHATAEEVRDLHEKTRLGLVSAEWVGTTYYGEYFIYIH